jgi:hypothetical protein
VRWLICESCIHPKANNTTLRVAEDLAKRMDYDTGHARYCLDETAARLGVDRSTVKRHVAILRELGALAWVIHGTKTNTRRLAGLAGYAGTATIYAAVIPASFDRAMGHQVVGTGYEARIVVDYRQPATVPGKPADQPSEPVDNSPVDNAVSDLCAPPSLSSAREEGKLKVEGGSKDTPRKRARRQTESAPPRKSSSNSTGRSPLQVARDITIARQVRALVNWTQTEKVRRLAFSLRPLIDRGLNAQQIASDLYGMCIGWRPAAPANFIRAQLAKEAAPLAPLDDAEAIPGYDTPGTFTAPTVDLMQEILAANARGMAAYSARQAERGLDNLTDEDAAAAMAAFLGEAPEGVTA